MAYFSIPLLKSPAKGFLRGSLSLPVAGIFSMVRRNEGESSVELGNISSTRYPASAPVFSFHKFQIVFQNAAVSCAPINYEKTLQ